MPLKNRIEGQNHIFFETTRVRLLLGLIVSLFYAFSFYALLYVFREFLRYYSFVFNEHLWVLESKEVVFYNLFYAFIAVILGQSFFFTFVFDRPKKIFSKKNYRRNNIVNDQRFLSWYFLSWFSKLGTMYGFLLTDVFSGGYYVFSFYPDYNYLFILIIVVLFLQTWTSIRLVFKRKSLKWMFVSGIVVSLLSFGMSKIDLIDYVDLNKKISEKKIVNKYKLELPESGSYEKVRESYFNLHIYIVKSKIEKEGITIIVNNEIVSLDRLVYKILEFRAGSVRHLSYRIKYLLHVDKDIKMSYVEAVKQEFFKVNSLKISYVVVPINREYNSKYYTNHVFAKDYWFYQRIGFSIQDKLEKFDKLFNIINIKKDGLDCVSVGGLLIDVPSLKVSLKKIIEKDPNYGFAVYTNEDDKYSEHLKVLTSTKHAVDELRSEYADKVFMKEYGELNDKEERLVKEKYPYRVLELSGDAIRVSKQLKKD